MSADHLKIGILSFRHPSDASVGVANVVSRLSRHFREFGHEVWVYYPVRDDCSPGPELWEGVHAVPIFLTTRLHGPLGLEREVSVKMARALRPDLDVVLVNNEFGACFADLAKRTDGSGRRPLKVVALHGLAIHFMESGRSSRRPGLRPQLGYWLDIWALRALERQSLVNADLIVACSSSVRNDARSTYGIPPERVSVVYNGTDTRVSPATIEREQVRVEFGLSQSENIVSFVGADPHRKGLDIAKGAVQLLRQRGIAVTLLNVGNQSPSEEGMVSVGRVREEAKRSILLSSDMFVLPSSYEGFPAAIQEAAALGIPVVTSQGSGLDIGEPGRDYALVHENSAEAYAATIGELLKDRALLARMGEAGRVALGSRSYRDQAMEYLRLFENALQNRSLPPRHGATALSGTGG